MARFGRRQVQSRLRPPTTVGAATTFRPLQIGRADLQKQGQVATRRPAHFQLRPPAVVGAAVVFSPVRVGLASQLPVRLLRRAPHPEIRGPAAVGAPVVFAAVAVRSARVRKLPARAYSRSRTILYPAGAAVATQEMGLLTMGVGT